MKKILFAAAEALPFIKVGGLGDVMGSLPAALNALGADARVVLPLYAQIPEQLRQTLTFVTSIGVPSGWRVSHCGIFQGEHNGVTYYLLDNEQYFKRSSVYGERDDAERFAFFSKAVLEVLPHIGFYPDVIHANDWHTALVPLYLNAFYRQTKGYESTRTVISIHNIEFQGKYDPYILGDVFGLDAAFRDILMYDGCLNILKGGIESADTVVAVSESYAKEILDPFYSSGLHHILQARNEKLVGIVNGIDTELFNPKTDQNLTCGYDLETLRFKTLNKRALQKELGLAQISGVPLIGMVTRLTPQKGLGLIREAMDEISTMDMQLVVLGSGDSEFEAMIQDWSARVSDKVGCSIGFSPTLASRIYAGADVFFMPSRSEPCGLAQMIAMRYGTVPVVHAVGGLKDTVIPFNPETREGNGVTFQSYEVWDMLDALRRALSLYHQKQMWRAARRNGMSRDFSWGNSAKKYLDVYCALTGVQEA
ncbi:glycogen synthase GlgA [Oscillospiraceae bacterium LTW-04]|nr:glycogen synthase GlgA [Oscillospiraceae bacterium MB24-C1]